MPDEPVCITVGCGKKALWKGLCRSCYGQAKDLIEKDLTNWDELANLGMVVLEGKPFKTEFFKRKQALTHKIDPNLFLKVATDET